ncbi:unnamed protein product [Lupinus luteus]|uniref:S-protein homolog n=1 Tax=Lupinus luteus TaxID=3873 RepID=A0AAV1X6Y1_LUPLU
MATLLNKIELSWFMLVTIFVTLQMMNSVESFNILPRANVVLINKLDNDELAFHCKDRVRDDGFHALSPNQKYSFGFTLDVILNRTLWFCSFEWQKQTHQFDIFIQMRDKCTTCEWSIHQEGPCRFVPETRSDICFPWQKKSDRRMNGDPIEYWIYND